jgi:hypothetical protein
MKTITVRALIACVVLWILAGCAGSPVLPSVTPPFLARLTSAPSPTLPPTATPTASPTLLPTSFSSPILGPSPLPSLAPTRLPPTPWHTATVPRRTPIPRTAQTPVLPTVPSEGWDTNTLLVGPGSPGRLYALQGERDARYFNSAKRRLLISDDLGDTWSPFPGGLPVAPTCLANVDLDYATQDALYASTCQGLFRWSGDQWTLISSQETRQVAIVYGRPQELWAIAAPQKGGPVLRSDDGGKTWHSASDGLVHFNGLATLGIDPRNTQTIYGIIMPKYGGSYLRRMFVGSQWNTLPTPLGNRQIDTGMTIDGATGDLYVTVFTEQGWQLHRTRNPDVTDANAVVWEKVSDFPPGPWGYASMLASGATPQGLALFVKLAPTNCSSSDARCDPFVQRSVDGGKTWKRLVIR